MRIRHSFSSRWTGKIDQHNKHRTPFPALAREVIRISDVILYILDARFVDETRNRNLERYMKESGKVVITVLNKCDLIDVQDAKLQKDLSELQPYLFLSTKTNEGRKHLRDQIKIIIKKLRQNKAIYSQTEHSDEEALTTVKAGIGKERMIKITDKAHVGIVGYPNTGKSSIINMLTGRSAAKTSLKAGFTKGIQKIRFSKDILILDTPGVIEQTEMKSRDQFLIDKHTKIGAKTYDSVRDPELTVQYLLKTNKEDIETFYDVDSEDDVEVLLEKMGRRRGYLKKGNLVDTVRAAKAILKDWQSGAILKGRRK